MRRRQMYAVKAAAPQAAVSVSAPPQEEPANKHACPNCGKVYPRGLHLHVRACKK